MSDEQLDDQLHAYAAHVRSTGRLPSSTEIRDLAHRRRQRHIGAAMFGVVLFGVLGLGLGLDAGTAPNPIPPASVAPVTPTPLPTSSPKTPPSPAATPSSPQVDQSADQTSASPRSSAKTVTSNVSQLTRLGIDLNVGVLIDVADDGQDRYLEIGTDGVVDFTGTTRTDNTMMALKPAKLAKKSTNRVVIAPPFYNEDLGTGSCVADTAPGKLRLAPCDPGATNQTWEVIPAGDSGQFELHGAFTQIRVDNGKIITNGQGYVGLQTIKFAP